MSYPIDDVYAESLHDWLDEREAIERDIDAADLSIDAPPSSALPLDAADFLHGVTILDPADLPF